MNASELISWAEEQHKFYCGLGQIFLQKFNKDFKVPGFSVFCKSSGAAGWARYRKGICDYNLVYLLSAGEEFRRTIAHEVAHFITHQLAGYSSSHGDLFKFVVEQIYGRIGTRYHCYIRQQKAVELAFAIMKMRKLQEAIKKEELKAAANKGK